MEIQLILGSNNSGKSKYAEELAVETGSKLVYLATMVSQNEENEKRIEKHRIQRQGRGFFTVEAAWNIHEIPFFEAAGEADSKETENVKATDDTREAEKAGNDVVVLLEDVSNLLANGIFMHGADAKQTLEQILLLAKRCKMLLIVSIAGLSADGYDEETASYINQLNWLNEQLAGYAVNVVEMKADGRK